MTAPYLDPRDAEYAESLPADERDTVIATVSRFRRPDRLRVGDALPPMELLRLEDGAPIRLGSLTTRQVPVVLVFGSFTWPPFRRRSGDVETLHRAYRARAETVFVYIAEAHSTDGWQLQANLDEGVLIANHTTIEERFEAARQGVARLGLTLPVLVDPLDDAASNAFAAWPERIYVVDQLGRIAHVGGPGPFEFEPDAAAAALDGLL